MGASRSRPEVIQKFTKGGENERIKYAISNMEDSRRNKKDTFAAFPNLDDLTSFFGVYDGHGGTEVASLCAAQFHTEVLNHPDYQNNLVNAVRMAFFRMDEMLEQSDEWMEFLARPPPPTGLFAFKHRKDLPPEEQMVTCDPELHTIPITPDIEFLLIVSDGIWDYLSSQGVVDFVRKKLIARMRLGFTDLRNITETLCDRCQLSADNATAILVQFKMPPPPRRVNLSSDGASSSRGPVNLFSDGGGSSSRDAPPSAAEHDDEIVEVKDDEAGGGDDKPLLDGADSFSTADESL
ncbi:hypothetical protein HU200_007297 [Digitaria exilis]|uniref:protein-serine/threonine phosphatase n=1 Tax=Digitaria exilis TaxID=1010633 RepID=A0A835KPW5_9POAL|nr:hypothetical protein HU200_007297 [Digitaria exilis]